MTGEHTPELDRARALMMSALDGEASAEDRQELASLLDARPDLRQEWEELRRMQEATRTMTLTQPPPEVWDTYWVSVYRRLERGVAWLLVSAGAVVLLAWGAWHLLHELLGASELPGPIRVAILALVLGGAMLLVSVVRERLFTSRHDRYSKEVLR